MATPTTPQLPENITVARDPGRNTFRLFIDGAEFPYLIDGKIGAATTVQLNEAPSVTVTLVAKSVEVRDDFFKDANFDHSHDEDEDGGVE